MKQLKTSYDIIGDSLCTGCFGCQDSCPTGAIKLALNAEGFYRPTTNRIACKSCLACCQHCPVIKRRSNEIQSGGVGPIAYAAWATSEAERLSSSSGGVFPILAKAVITSGGVVAGCIWGEEGAAKHILAYTFDEVEKMRGSKYVQSNVNNVYGEIDKHLRTSDTPVLFSGTPCQVAAMAEEIKPIDRKRVLLVELFCHGVTSLRAFHNYLEEQFQGESISSFTFRDKTNGLRSVRAASTSGHVFLVNTDDDIFFRGFMSHLYIMESCHKCIFAKTPKAADISIGDFWGCPPEWCDKRGVSVVLAHTTYGFIHLENLSQRGMLELRQTQLKTATEQNQHAVTGLHSINRNRAAFLSQTIWGGVFKILFSRYAYSALRRMRMTLSPYVRAVATWYFAK
jgi:coenzyme F420-reducing hydrogenase beta subunit